MKKSSDGNTDNLLAMVGPDSFASNLLLYWEFYEIPIASLLYS